MPRITRSTLPDGLFHVTTRGNRSQRTYVDEMDYFRFEQHLAVTTQRCGWTCLAYCLMPNHYHVLLDASQVDLSNGMQRLNGWWAQRFNVRHGFEGHLFERRFRSWVAESTWHLLRGAAYIFLNPCRAGLCDHPGAWPWSSYRYTVGLEQTSFVQVGRVLEHFGSGDETRRAFAAFVDEEATRRTKRTRPRAWPWDVSL